MDTASLSSGVGTVTIMFFFLSTSTNFYNFYFGSCKALLLVPLRPFEKKREEAFVFVVERRGRNTFFAALSANTRSFPQRS